MIAEILRVFFWVCLAHLTCCSTTAETPKECAFGTPDYNETLCSETCSKAIHGNESYCSNFTETTSSTQKQTQQDVGGPVALSGLMTSTPQQGIHMDLATPKIDLNDFLPSSGISLKGSAIACLSVLLFTYF